MTNKVNEDKKKNKKITLDNLRSDIGRIVDKAEDRLSDAIEGSNFEAPTLCDVNFAEKYKWYKKEIDAAKSGDGSGYHIYIKHGSDVKNGPLCIFFSGGGVAWNEFMADRPVSSGKIVANEANYYWNNLRPVTQLMNIGVGITDTNSKINPFYEWNFIVIPYSTGDFHLGRSEYEYNSIDGVKKILYFNGYNNYTEAMKISVSLFENPEKILIAGDSAGGFAVSALSDEIIGVYYKKCQNITVLSDSSLLEKSNWSDVLKDVWNSPKQIIQPLHSTNPVLDWYSHLYNKYGNRVKYLYAGSKRDYLLSAFRNDVINNEYKTDRDIQREYEQAFINMLSELKHINNQFGIFVYNWRNKVHTGGGTIHTAIRTPYFFMSLKTGKSMSRWLMDAVNNDVYDVRYH